MGNSATKEQRPPPARLRSTESQSYSSPPGSGPNSPSYPPSLERPPSHPVYNVRTGRGSRPDLSTLLHIRSSAPQSDTAGLENRKETKQEREARKLERERIARAKERERSIREEHVDGGYLVTQGVYTGIEDYNKGVVRQLMIERRIAPFWRGLNDHSDSWTENQLVAAARGLSIPAPDEIPVQDEPKASSQAESERKMPEKNINNLTVAISSRSQSFNSDTSSNLSPLQASFPPGPGSSAEPASSSGSALFRGRAKTLASLNTSAKTPQGDITPREMQLPKDPHVNGQPIEAYLYKDASECPICFLYYPPYLNKTRCCDQSICSECFVQIKRPDPHVPEHADPTAPPSENTEPVDPEELVSEPAACPFCVQPEFGVTYDPPPFRRGLTYVNHPSTHPLANSSAMSSESSLGSFMSNGGRMSPTSVSRRRTTSVSATSPLVITTDRVRPDWHQKLATARAHTARRSAAATALHTAAYLMGNRNHEGEGRALGAFGRRGLLRRTSGPDTPSGNGVSQLNMLALMSERYASSSAARGEEGEPSMTPGPRGSSRRNRVDDLEDMMMMEAIRLSLASEEERRKKEEKDAKKDAKKKEKENKKAEKVAKKTGIYPSSANQSTGGIDSTLSSDASTSQGDLSISGKSKATQPLNSEHKFEQGSYCGPLVSTSADAQEHLERARAQILPNDPGPFSSPYASPPYRPSHLRTLSNASSSTSSIDGSLPGSLKSDHRGQGSSFEVSPNASGINIPSAGSAQDTYISGTPPGGGAGLEPMFNFRSLAAMVGEDGKMKDASSEENIDGQASNQEGESFGKSTTEDDADRSSLTATPGDPMVQANLPATETPNTSNIDVPIFRITASSRTNSDFDDTKHVAMVDENISRNDVQTS